jgi:D-aminoacyl-tRNA deacylase
MRGVVERVKRAEVRVDGECVGRIGPGLLVLVGVSRDDTEAEAVLLASKILGLRVFEDAEGKMNRDVVGVGGGILAVSQFTLLGDARKGKRPSFAKAMEPEGARALFEVFVDTCRRQPIEVATGRFRAQMEVELVGDGPVTILVDTARAF